MTDSENDIFLEVIELTFSQRREYFEHMRKLASDRANASVGWPDTLLFLEWADFRDVLDKFKESL